MRTAAFLTAVVALGWLAPAGPAQGRKGTGTKADPFVLTADELGKESVKDAEATNKRYAGKFLEVTGTVGVSIYDEMLYLPTKATFPGGGVCEVGIRYPKASRPAVKAGDKATFVGEFTLVAVLGPTLKDCTLVEPKKP